MAKTRIRSKSLKKEKNQFSRYRDAGTGKFVTEKYADKHPKTTIKEKISPIYNKPKKSKDRPETDDTGPRRK